MTKFHELFAQPSYISRTLSLKVFLIEVYLGPLAETELLTTNNIYFIRDYKKKMIHIYHHLDAILITLVNFIKR